MNKKDKEAEKRIYELLGLNYDDNDDDKDNNYDNNDTKNLKKNNNNNLKEIKSETNEQTHQKEIKIQKENIEKSFNVFINEDDIPSYDNYDEYENQNNNKNVLSNVENPSKELNEDSKNTINSINILTKKDDDNKNDIYNELTLNNKNNPFIKAQNELNQASDFEKDNNNKNGLAKREKKLNNLLVINELFLEKENLINFPNEDNLEVYRNLIYGGKKFYLMTSVKDINKYQNLYYYCSLHRTSRFSEEYGDKTKKRISICEAKIMFEIKNKIYYFANDHSDKCKNIKKQSYENIQNINTEISNYNNFREELIKFLNLNPVISFHDFAKEGQNLYDKNSCNFNVSKNTYSNIYYEWRKKSNFFNKYSIFEHKMTKNNKIFLRDYTYKILYSKTGKNLFEHEHIIYVSDFFIKKLRMSRHFYIDGTFVFPEGFKQLIVILYYDEQTKKRYPGIFSLINNKTEAGYLELLSSIYNIITIEKTKNIKLESYTTDFEIGLMNALDKIFPNVRKVGCFFHFTRALRDKMKKLGLLTKEKAEESKKMLKEFFELPYSFEKDLTIIDTLCNKYNEYCPSFVNYFRNQWIKYFNNGCLVYNNLEVKFRSNSYIENYNRIIKLKLSKFLYGKSKTKITWPIFHYFILEEEDEYRKNYIYYEESTELKSEEKDNVNINNKSINELNVNINTNRKWLKLNYYSCRYDTFMFLYTFIIKPNLQHIEIENNGENNIINFYNIISSDILKMSNKELNEGIWKILDRYKENYHFINEGYKQYHSITQLFGNFQNNPIFCLKYYSFEGCSICTEGKTNEIFLKPIINFDNIYIHMFNIEELIKNNIKNETTVCPNCGYFEGKILDENNLTHYKIIAKVEYPTFLFISFDFAIGVDHENIYGNSNSISMQNLLAFNRLKDNLNVIKNMILDNIMINNNSYSLIGIVCSPYSGHYNGIIINMNEDVNLLKKATNYFYDSQKNENYILPIDNWRDVLDNNYPYILIYLKK